MFETGGYRQLLFQTSDSVIAFVAYVDFPYMDNPKPQLVRKGKWIRALV